MATTQSGTAVAVESGRRRRRAELALIAFATVVVTCALVVVDLSTTMRPTSSELYLSLGYLGLFVVAHVAVRVFTPTADPLLLPCVALLNGLGLVMIHRLDLAAPDAQAAAPRQLAWTAGGIAVLVLVLWRVRDHRRLARYSYTAGLVGLVLIALPGLLPASVSEVDGARLWIRVGPVSLQPGEFAKLAIIVFAAAYLVNARDLFRTAGRRIAGTTLPRARDLAPLVVLWALSVGLLALEKELGASLLIYGVILAMIYAATGRASWVAIGSLMFAVSCVIAYALFSHVQTRVQVWLDPFADPTGSGYQMLQSLFGLGTGGLLGTGLGAGRPDLVPVANSDFIVEGIGEELGMVGLAAVLVVYAVVVTRGMRAALLCRDDVGTLLATGLSTTIGLQVFIVVGGVTNLIPETGLTTPFLSYGGSSLLANYALVGLLLVVSGSRDAPRARPAVPATPLSDTSTVLIAKPAAGR